MLNLEYLMLFMGELKDKGLWLEMDIRLFIGNKEEL